MKNKIIELCSNVVLSYNKGKSTFRFDGEYINHFYSLLMSYRGQSDNEKTIKEIRSFIKDNTNRMSFFRGDILYILSFLASNEENYKEFLEEVFKVYNILIEEGLRESHYLVLTSYAIAKYSKKEFHQRIGNDTLALYKDMKSRYSNVTNEEDHLQCALLAINNISPFDLNTKIEEVSKEFQGFKLSKNSIQALSLSVILSKKNYNLDSIQQLLEEFKKRDIQIAHQFIPILGMIQGGEGAKRYADMVESVMNLLCEEEEEYQFYMDKSFRPFISVMIIEISRDNKDERYLEELLAMGIYSFLISKNQSVFGEILA